MKDEVVKNLAAVFHREFGYKPGFTARAPGRVNLIGEHTDYNGCPVLPMALEQCFTAVFAPRPAGAGNGSRVSVVNTDSRFPGLTFIAENPVPPYETGSWGNYVKAGVQTILSYGAAAGKDCQAGCGFEAVITSSLPAAAGLSSSSALVVLSGLMAMASLGLSVPKDTLAKLFADGERYVGTQGGGMDQAVCMLSEAGKALKIEFNPFSAEPVNMPRGYSVVVMDSTVKAEKTRAAMDRYNIRTIECRLGTAVLKAAFSRRYGREVKLGLLGDMTSQNLGIPEEEIIPFAVDALSDSAYSLSGAAALLGTGTGRLAEEYCRRRDGSVLPEPPGGFKLMQRVLHVLTEWKRVEDSVSFLSAGDAAGFGVLMNGSHESCRRLFEISCPELDTLIALALEEGALGARLTGAGFGGCAVALVMDGDLPAFLSAVGRRYYGEYLKRTDGNVSRFLFICRPGRGAGTSVL
ncbi:MAG: galactokinase [Spirochaetales bacterium]|nr:MAG: galactokinase [Spirochaetales bacterium]